MTFDHSQTFPRAHPTPEVLAQHERDVERRQRARNDAAFRFLVYEATAEARDLRACHLVKWHVSVLRHLATGHGIRFESQGPRTGLDAVIEQHKSLHNSTVLWPDLPHVHTLAQ